MDGHRVESCGAAIRALQLPYIESIEDRKECHEDFYTREHETKLTSLQIVLIYRGVEWSGFSRRIL